MPGCERTEVAKGPTQAQVLRGPDDHGCCRTRVHTGCVWSSDRRGQRQHLEGDLHARLSGHRLDVADLRVDFDVRPVFFA
jgi:hypothetical protein